MRFCDLGAFGAFGDLGDLGDLGFWFFSLFIFSLFLIVLILIACCEVLAGQHFTNMHLYIHFSTHEGYGGWFNHIKSQIVRIEWGFNNGAAHEVTSHSSTLHIELNILGCAVGVFVDT